MSYWILAVLIASSIVVFEGAVAWWIVPLCIIVVAWKRGQENWKRVDCVLKGGMKPIDVIHGEIIALCDKGGLL